MAVWATTIGIFEDQGGWVAGNNPSLIEITDFTAEGTDYILINCASFKEMEGADMGIKKLPNRINMSIPLKKVAETLQLECYVLDTGSSYAEDLMNTIMTFYRNHQKFNAEDIYFVMRRYAGAAWRYPTYEDADENTDRKYLQGKILDIRKKINDFGIIRYTLQFGEANI